MSSGRLANTIFQGRSTDGMLVADAYKISSSETRNSLFSAVKGIYADAITGLQANPSSIRQLTELVMASKYGVVDKAQMFDQALRSLGSSLPNLLGTLGGTLQNKLAEAAGTYIGPNAQKSFNLLYDNAAFLMSASNITDASQMVSFVSELTGKSDLIQFVNIEAETAIIGGIAKELVNYGMPELFDDVIAMARSDQVRLNALAFVSSTAVSGSDLVTVNKIIDHIGLTMFLENNPDAINQILSSYYFGSSVTVADYPTKRDELVTTLNRINPNWTQVQRNGTWIYTLEPYMSATEQAKTLLSLQEPDRTFCDAASAYKKVSVSSVVTDLYPNAYIS